MTTNNEHEQDYWSYRESLERTGHFLWLPVAEQAKFVDGIAAQYSGDLGFCSQQLQHAQSKSDLKHWNASGIGSLAFMSLWGPQEQREAWRQEHARLVGVLQTRFDVSADMQDELARATVTHSSFPDITAEMVASARNRK